MKNGYVKITFEDAEIARIFFENDKHFDEFLSQVCRYYLGIENVFKYKNVKKYFETYKKVMDRVIVGRDTGSKGGLQRIENQKDTNNTLEGPLQGPVEPPLEVPLVAKERKEIKLIKEIKNKEEIFEVLWKGYPTKAGKAKAKEKFLKLSDDSIELIEHHLPIFSVNKEFSTYTHPHLTTYLNEKRYLDEIIDKRQFIPENKEDILKMYFKEPPERIPGFRIISSGDSYRYGLIENNQ